MAPRTSPTAAADDTAAATNTEAPPPAQAAALGRIVHVVGPVAEHNGADVAPAVITRVWGPDMVNVTVLPDGYMPRHATSVRVYPDEQTARQALIETTSTGTVAFWPARV